MPWDEERFASAKEARAAEEDRDKRIDSLVSQERQAFALELGEPFGEPWGAYLVGFDFFVYGQDDARIRIRWAQKLLDHLDELEEGSLERQGKMKRMASVQKQADRALGRLLRIDREALVDAVLSSPMDRENDDGWDEGDEVIGAWAGLCPAGDPSSIAMHFGWEGVLVQLEAAKIGKEAQAGKKGSEKKAL